MLDKKGRGLATPRVDVQEVTKDIALNCSLSGKKWVAKQPLSPRVLSTYLNPLFHALFGR
jgi:hypothetical protein